MGRTKNQVQKPAKVHQLKGGEWAVLVTLVQPRRLEGKMRSGRQKFERQTESLANALCAEINALLFDKELARQLSKREVDIAKKVFWEILEPHHPGWVEHLVDIVHHAERTDFRPPDETVPTVEQAARIFYREYLQHMEKETILNHRYAIAFLLPRFGHLKTYEMTDQQILKMAYGTEPLKFMRSTARRQHTADQAEEHLWAVEEESTGRRPWSLPTAARFLRGVRAFKRWMHESIDPVTQTKRNWCPKCMIGIPNFLKSSTNPIRPGEKNGDLECARNPALTVPQVQALIDVAWVAFRGKFAPFYVHGFWCGSRAKEISRTDVTAFNSHDGMLTISDSAAKTDRGRESEVYPNTITMVEALRFTNNYTREGLRPDRNQRTVIQILAGFASNSKGYQARAELERKRLEARGIILPNYNWGRAYPRNALRRTALSMHYKLFLNVALTTGWAGNSPGVFQDFYKRLVTKEEARQYWTMLPGWLKAKAEIEVELPKGHKLDSAVTEDVRTAVSAACEAMRSFTHDIAATEAQKNSAPKRLRSKTRWAEEDNSSSPNNVEKRRPDAMKSETSAA